MMVRAALLRLGESERCRRAKLGATSSQRTKSPVGAAGAGLPVGAGGAELPVGAAGAELGLRHFT